MLIGPYVRLLPLAACVLLGACGWGELDDSAPLTMLDNFRVIEEGQAYRSAQLDDSSLRLVIEQYGIRTIVNLRGENEQTLWYQNELAVARELGVKLVDIAMSARSLPSRQSLLLLYDTFKTADYPILIHCQAGADRTGAAAAIWRMVMQGAPREVAARELSRCYGHFPLITPAMDVLVQIFQPDREWIEHEYPVP